VASKIVFSPKLPAALLERVYAIVAESIEAAFAARSR